jgi:3-hydroxyacyl-[acyl-carrier-protein] dehydratase
MRWFWIDRFEEFVRARHATAVKNVSLAEEHMHDHFPGAALMPNSLVVEGMAQTAGAACVASGEAGGRAKVVYFMTVDKCKFRKPVVPGDVLHLKITKLQNRKNLFKFEAKAMVGDVVVTEAKISAMIMG